MSNITTKITLKQKRNTFMSEFSTGDLSAAESAITKKAVALARDVGLYDKDHSVGHDDPKHGWGLVKVHVGKEIFDAPTSVMVKNVDTIVGNYADSEDVIGKRTVTPRDNEEGQAIWEQTLPDRPLIITRSEKEARNSDGTPYVGKLTGARAERAREILMDMMVRKLGKTAAYLQQAQEHTPKAA